MRPLTLLSAILFVLSGAYLFAVKHRSEMLGDQIAQVNRATLLDEQRISVLQAQWALEASPSRLQALASQFTDLQPMKPAQLVTLAQLTQALPAPGSAVPEVNPVGSGPALPVEVSQAAPPAPPPLPVKVAAVDHMDNVETLLRHLPRHARRQAPREVAAYHPDNGGSALAPLAMAAPQPLVGAQVMSVRAVSAPEEDGGSMLGMAQSGGSAN